MIKEDNQGTIASARNSISHARTKHIVKFHYVCETLHDGSQGFFQNFAQGGGAKLRIIALWGGGKDLSVTGVDLQCTCHFSIQVSSLIKR